MARATTTSKAARFDFSKVHTCRIHPGIGIARVGNSPDGYFIGPEARPDFRTAICRIRVLARLLPRSLAIATFAGLEGARPSSAFAMRRDGLPLRIWAGNARSAGAVPPGMWQPPNCPPTISPISVS